jgi:predicted NBD/HSP70 family sugar kinase
MAAPIDIAERALSDNERRVLAIVRRDTATTRADVTQSIELTAQSMSRIIDSLVAQGFLTRGDRVPNGRGQPSARLILNRSAAYSVGVSIMTDSVSGVVMDLGGDVIAADRERLSGVDLDAILSAISSLHERLLRAASIRLNQVAGIGIGVTGYFVGQGRRVNPPKPLDALAMVDLDAVVAELLRRPVWLDNDAKAAAMGEVLTGVGRRFRNFGYVHFAMGIGGAVVIDGQVFAGAFGNAGEFGGVLHPSEHRQRPSLEMLRRMVVQRGARFADIDQMLENFELALPGVEDWLCAAKPKLDAIVSAISAVLDPEAIVLGGRLPRVLAVELSRRLSYYSVPRRGQHKPAPLLLASEVSGDAAAIGAAATPLKARFFL